MSAPFPLVSSFASAGSQSPAPTPFLLGTDVTGCDRKIRKEKNAIQLEYLEPGKTVVILRVTSIYECPTVCHSPGPGLWMLLLNVPSSMSGGSPPTNTLRE